MSAAGVRLRATRAGTIRWRCRGRLPDELRRAIRKHKSHLLVLLRPPPPPELAAAIERYRSGAGRLVYVTTARGQVLPCEGPEKVPVDAILWAVEGGRAWNRMPPEEP